VARRVVASLRTATAAESIDVEERRRRSEGQRPPAGLTAVAFRAPRSDRELVEACLEGDQGAWDELIHRYKALIYSVALRFGATAEDAADIFQQVCIELFNDLPRLRNRDNVGAWLMTVAKNRAFHWKRRTMRRVTNEVGGMDADALETVGLPDDVADALENEQLVREAVSRLPGRCQRMVQMLFFEEPPRPYAEVARDLGLAVGSIGFIRKRCLERLQVVLEELEP